jgi:hypothetical protein
LIKGLILGLAGAKNIIFQNKSEIPLYSEHLQNSNKASNKPVVNFWEIFLKNANNPENPQNTFKSSQTLNNPQKTYNSQKS